MSDHQPDAVADLESATAAGHDAAKDAQAELEDANAAVARAQPDATYLLDEIDKIKVEQIIFYTATGTSGTSPNRSRCPHPAQPAPARR
jgi:hypothetical protein